VRTKVLNCVDKVLNYWTKALNSVGGKAVKCVGKSAELCGQKC